MINFNNILKQCDKFENDINDVFNLSTKHEGKVTVYEDSRVVVFLTLTYQQSRTQARWLYPTIKYKNYGIEKDGISVKIDSDMSMSSNLVDISVREMVNSCLDTCNVNGIDDISLTLNGYTMEVVKTSSKYVTICEHINAVRFEKRFDSLESLFNYLNYRKALHEKVNIGINVSDTELENIQRAIDVLKNNSESVFSEIISVITPIRKRFLDMDNFTLEYVKSNSTGSHFKLSYNDSDFDMTLECVYNPLIGVRFADSPQIHNTKSMEIFSIMLEMVVELERSCGGLLDRYFNIIKQMIKYKSKTNSVDVKSDLKQMNKHDVVQNVFKSFTVARGEESMESKPVYITPFMGYKRSIVLDGVMKNRKKCDLVVRIKNGKMQFNEFKLQVEKNRMIEEVTEFLSSYFI